MLTFDIELACMRDLTNLAGIIIRTPLGGEGKVEGSGIDMDEVGKGKKGFRGSGGKRMGPRQNIGSPVARREIPATSRDQQVDCNPFKRS
jgi:hypothetical protein